MNNLITSLEFSPSGVRLITGYVFQEKVYVLEAMESEPLSFDANGFPEKKPTEDTLRMMLAKASTSLGRELGNFVVLLPPDEFQVREGVDTTVTVTDNITQKDFLNCISMINKHVKMDNSAIVYDDPISFTDDTTGQSKEFPLGKKSENLSVRADAHMISRITYDYYRQILKDVGILPYLTLVSPFASSSFLCAFKAPLAFFSLEIEKDYSYISLTKDKRILFSKQLNFGINQAYEVAAKSLNITPEKMAQLGRLFGLREEAGFPYFTDEKLQLNDISSAIKDSFLYFENLRDELDQLDPNKMIPVIFIGSGSRIDGLDSFLGNVFSRQILSFSPKVIGARNESYIPCLGGIRITSNTYMNPLKENRRNEQNNDFARSSFSRD